MSRQPAKTLPLSMAQRALSRTASGVPVHSCARRKIAIILLFLGLSAAVLGAEDTREFKAIRHNESSAALFAPPPALRVLGPSHFPPPTLPLGEDVEVLLEASFGAHRADQDAIIAFAEGYRLGNYMMFMETLASTGYTGDVVLAIADDRVIREDVKEYLQTYAQGDTNKPGVVVYQLPLYCENDPNHWRRVMRSGDLDGFQMCQVGHHVYGWRDELGHVRETASDPREGRTVATIRYEWYWMVSLRYQKHAWLMLLDARDSLFQTNPFADVPRETENPDRPDGLLYFFGENANATRLGKSRKNRNWLAKGYGSGTIDILQDYPTICSGSTMGEQVAIETYLRAMVNEHDECEVRMMGSDQGFHNYLYYSQKLVQAETIRRLIVWEQGRGIINNLGAMRTHTLEEWGCYDPNAHKVYNWDGETLSPVAHQWDRDSHFFNYMARKQQKQWEKEWKNREKQS